MNYGFGKCQKYEEKEVQQVSPVKVQGGVEKEVDVAQEKPFSYVDTTGADLKGIQRKTDMEKSLKAPVKKGTKAGEAVYYLDGEKIGSVDILTTGSVKKMDYQSALLDMIEKVLL